MTPRSPRVQLHWAALACALTLASCAAPSNFTSPAGPRYAGGGPTPPVAERTEVAASPRTLHVVTFNIKFARAIDPAVALLGHDARLKDADVLLLQEMDARGTQRIARALGMYYVYYPATLHPVTGRGFGPAILSRWPLLEDRKLILPHRARFSRTERIAVAATVDFPGWPIRVYSVHVATGVELGPQSRRDQVQALLADADGPYPRVVVGGDFNSWGLGRLFAEHGYAWPTRDLGRTTPFADIDHIFLRGLTLRDAQSVGKVAENMDASDHDPVWVDLQF
jgi:endonuclease/exonuclease/phosphatase family metal-dependent hydrolase